MQRYPFFILFQLILLSGSFAQCNISITGDRSICEGDTVTLVASGASSYTWMPGNFTSATLVASPAGTTIYTVTASTGTCVSTTTVQVNVNPLPDAAFTDTPYQLSGCGYCYYSTTSGTAASYSWDFGDGTTGTGWMVQFCYYVSGNYTITLTTTSDSGCTAKSSFTESAWIDPPHASFTATPQPTTLANANIYFNDLSSGFYSAVEWHFGDSANSTSTSLAPSFTYNDTGHYLVKLKVYDQWNCADSISKYVIISPVNGIDTYDKTVDLTVSPNPTHDNILLWMSTEAQKVSIIDQLGREVMELDNKLRSQKVDLSKTENGIYFLRVKTKVGFVIRKILKE